MRIVLVTNALFRADGIAHAALQVGCGLVEDGHEVSVVYPDREYEQPQLDAWAEIAEELVPVADLSVRRGNLLGTARGTAGAIRSIRRARPDLVYVHQPAHAALAWLAGLGRPTRQVLHLHGHPSDTPGRAQRIGVRRADRIVGVSNSVTEAWHPHGADPRRCTVIHNGVDLERFTPTSPEQRRAAKQDLDLPPDAPVVGFVGRFTAPKGIHVLARAFADLAIGHPHVHLVMLGATAAQDSARTDLEKALAGTRATILDARDDPLPVIRAFDIGVVPSEMEAFSLVVLELMACGIPVLGSAVGGTPEALGPDLGGRLTPFGDSAALTGQLRSALAEIGDPGFAAAYRARATEFDADRWRAQMVDFLTRSAD